MGRWKTAVVVMALVLGGCTQSGSDTSEGVVEDVEEVGPTGPQTYTVSMDAPSPEGQHIGVAAFFPLRVKVRPGDTVMFENLGEAPHTVTFGASPLDPEPLKLITKAGTENPVVFGPCFADPAPAADAESCPTPPPAAPPAFSGAGFWNSGVVPPKSAGAPPMSMTVAADAAPGSYMYSCMLHKYMSASIEVMEQDIDRESVADVKEKTDSLRATALKSAAKLTEPAVPPVVGTGVVAGWGDKVSAVNRFAPAVAKVKAGETVTWKAMSEFEPHTVTFESPFKSPMEPGVFTAGGTKAGARHSGGFAHSGLFGPAPFGSDSFSLVFTKPGTYSYVCVLHPGMAGQVEVTP